MKAADIDCIELVEPTTTYFEAALPDSDVRRIEQHLLVCDGCAGCLQQMRTTQETLGHLDAAAVPAPGRDKLLAVFRAWKRGEEPPA